MGTGFIEPERRSLSATDLQTTPGERATDTELEHHLLQHLSSYFLLFLALRLTLALHELLCEPKDNRFKSW